MGNMATLMNSNSLCFTNTLTWVCHSSNGVEMNREWKRLDKEHGENRWECRQRSPQEEDKFLSQYLQ